MAIFGQEIGQIAHGCEWDFVCNALAWAISRKSGLSVHFLQALGPDYYSVSGALLPAMPGLRNSTRAMGER